MRPLYPSWPRWAMRGLLWVALPLIGPGLAAHTFTRIEAQLARQADGAELQLRLSLRDLRHLVDVDRDADGRLTPEEILAARDALARELAASLRLQPREGPACRTALTGYRLDDLASVEVRLRLACAGDLDGALLSSGLFGGSGHRYLLHVQLVDTEPPTAIELRHDHNRAELPPRARRGIATWLVLTAAALLGAGALALGWRWRPGRPH